MVREKQLVVKCLITKGQITAAATTAATTTTTATTTTATTTAVKAVAADPCNNKRKGKRELRKKEEANERIMVPACWLAHLPHGQEFVGLIPDTTN